jgi:hypothetical protein
VHATNLPDCVIDSIIFPKRKNHSESIIRKIPEKDKPLKRPPVLPLRNRLPVRLPSQNRPQSFFIDFSGKIGYDGYA